MSSDELFVNITFAPKFQRQLRILAKKYRHIYTDIQPILEQLQTGTFVGDQISGTGYTVMKVRVKNSDIQKGKSGGYRLAYEIESPTNLFVLKIYYSKSEQADISAIELITILAELAHESQELS
jgi:mRNA-degrading endonuclease RelE of RelBE toxin-antitoxin system